MELLGKSGRDTRKGNTAEKMMFLALLRMQQRIEMLYLLEQVENMQIFAHENLVFFAIPSIKYANTTHNAAGSLSSHSYHIMHKHTHSHTPSTPMQPAKEMYLGCSMSFYI